MAYHKNSLKKKVKYGCKRHTHNIVKIALKQIFINPIQLLRRWNWFSSRVRLGRRKWLMISYNLFLQNKLGNGFCELQTNP